MDPCLRRMLNKTVNVRTVTGYSPGGQETLAAAVAVPAYVEVKRGTGGAVAGTEGTVNHLVITETAITRDQRVWLPGDSPTDLALGKRPVSVDTFHDVLGNVDHYEVTL